MKYEEVEVYIRAVADDPSLALIPIPMAAELFGITGAGIAARVKSGTLRGIKVGGSRYVILDSVVATLKKSDEEVAIVRRFLEDHARQGISSVEYAPVMDLLGLSSTLSADRTRIGWILGAVSRQTFHDGKGLLSVIVHRKGTKMPSENGFFGLVDGLVADGAIDDWEKKYNSREDFVAAETRRVIKAYRK
jgi:hypothetical protein